MISARVSRRLLWITSASALAIASAHAAPSDKGTSMKHQVAYRTIRVDGLSIFYRVVEPTEPAAYRADVKTAEVHILDGGHFLLDTAADEAAAIVRRFLLSSAPK